MTKLVTCKIALVKLVSIAEQFGFGNLIGAVSARTIIMYNHARFSLCTMQVACARTVVLFTWPILWMGNSFVHITHKSHFNHCPVKTGFIVFKHCRSRSNDFV